MCILIFETSNFYAKENENDILRCIIDFENKTAESVVYPANENVSNYPYEEDSFEGTLELFNELSPEERNVVDVRCKSIIGDNLLANSTVEYIRKLFNNVASPLIDCKCDEFNVILKFKDYTYHLPHILDIDKLKKI